MVNYNNGKIYKIESHLGDKVYIGSTTKEFLSQRMVTHRGDYKRWKQGKCNLITSFSLFDEYGIENCSIVLLESYPCESKDELHAREAHFIKTIQCVNKYIPGRTIKEYYKANKETINEKHKEYYEANKETINDKHKKYQEVNKEQLKEYKKEYYEAHRETINEKRKEYYDKNIGKMKEKHEKYRESNRDEINHKQRERRAALKLKKEQLNQ